MSGIDEIDLKILRILQQDSRVSNQDLAEQIALSASPCWRRVKRLQDEKVIRGYVALLDPGQLGLNVTAFTHVRLNNHHAGNVAAFDNAIAEWPEVLECNSTSGRYDYILKVVVSGLDSYEQFLSDRLLQISCVGIVDTSFSLRQKKFTSQLPLAIPRR